MKLRIAIGALLTLLILSLGWWFYSNLEYVSEEHTLPPRGQASYDPLYAASLALKAYGADPVIEPYFDLSRMSLKRGDTLVYYSDVRTLSPGDVNTLRGWVRSGGHLVVQLPLGEDGTPTLLAAFGMKSGTREDLPCPPVSYRAGTGADRPELCGYGAVHGSADDYTYSVGSGNELVYAQRNQGSGWIAVVSSMEFMDNALLKEPVNSRLMLRVVQPVPEGRVFLVYSLDVAGLPAIILRYGWPVVLVLALLLVAYLWAAIPRFGPLRPAGSPPRRALLEHVRAAAELQWRGNGERALYEAVRADMLLTLRRRHPAASGAGRRELLDSLAGITGLPRLGVRRALVMDSADMRTGFVERIATLLEIRKRL